MRTDGTGVQEECQSWMPLLRTPGFGMPVAESE